MNDYFAWTPITAKDIVRGEGAYITIPVGDKVSENQVGKKDFRSLVAAGVLRTQPYPKDIRTGESPRNAQLRKLNEQQKELDKVFKHELDIDDDEEDDGDISQS